MLPPSWDVLVPDGVAYTDSVSYDFSLSITYAGKALANRTLVSGNTVHFVHLPASPLVRPQSQKS